MIQHWSFLLDCQFIFQIYFFYEDTISLSASCTVLMCMVRIISYFSLYDKEGKRSYGTSYVSLFSF